MIRQHESLIGIIARTMEQIDSDPEFLPKLKAAASLILATNPASNTPASVENKGFFGFAR